MARVTRLGHPNVSGGEPVRAAGEIRWSPQRRKWVINNESGRYGNFILDGAFSPTPNNLRAAAALIQNAGFRERFELEYFPPRTWAQQQRNLPGLPGGPPAPILLREQFE